MSRIISKKRALLTAAIASLALVAVAIAFYSTVGSGDGDATTRTANPVDLAIDGDATTAELVPGDSVGITGTITNGNEGAAKVHDLAGSVDETPVGCNAGWFTITGVTIPDTDDVIEAGQSIGFTATLNMADAHDGEGNPVDQNACKGASLDIDWTSGLGS